ncbi:18445_t:CDS:2, partial [Entrophospora sp. SA101]
NGSSKDKKVIKKMRKDSEEEEEQNVFVGEIRRIKNKPEDINLVFEGEFMVFVTVKVKELRSLMGNLTHWEYVLNENEDNHEISMDADRFVI